MKIIPAVLSNQKEDYQKAFKIFETFENCDTIQLDIMDGRFVSTLSANLEEILQIPTKLKKQIHLMVEKPEECFELCKSNGIEEIIIHKESQFKAYDKFKNYEGMNFLLAINPETPVSEITNDLKHFSGILIMTVVPGKQGGEFLPDMLVKIDELRSIGFNRKIIVDGGVNQTTIDQVIKHNANELVVGSAIIKTEEPSKAYTAFVEILNDHELAH